MQLNDLLYPLIIPALPFIAGMAARWMPAHAHRAASPSLAVATAATLCVYLLNAKHEPSHLTHFDALAATMTLLVTLLGAFVLRFATRYLEGDPSRPRYLSWMCFTLASVLTLMLSNHLLLLLAAWTTTSLCLHKLLLYNAQRVGAIYAARKKFVFSRIAETCLLAAALILYAGHGTLRIDALSESIASGNHAGLPSAAFLLVFCAMLKSAQFPFHSWLPDTMDTPTPTSALMHAGIVNAGGFLILRLAPVFAAAPSALNLLAIIGTITAVFGAVVMLAQPAVKRSLAFSTIAQMGFMMIQCGLGAWGLALLHLVAHSLYKAHAFLYAGSAVTATPRAAIPLRTMTLIMGLLISTIFVSIAAWTGYQIAPGTPSTSTAFLAILTFAIAYLISRVWSGHAKSLPHALVIAFGLTIIAIALHVFAVNFLPLVAAPPPPVWLLAFIIITFCSLFFFQALLWRASAHPLGRHLYVHALNGFYIGPLANRMLNRLWPSKPLT